MRLLFRWAFRLLILLVVLLVAGVLLLDTVAREIAEYRLSRRTGLEVKIGKMNVGLFNPRVTVEHLVIYNSAEFGGSPLLDLPELHVEYDRSALFSRRLLFPLIRLNLAEVNIVEDKNGRLNLEALQPRGRQNGGPTAKATQGYEFRGINTLNLTLQGNVNFLSLKNPAQGDTLKLGIHHQLITGIKSTTNLQGDLLGVFTLVLLRDGINPLTIDATNANDHWQYWLDRLRSLDKK